MKPISRRTAIWNLATISTSLAYGREKATAFGLVGDRYHNSDYIRTALDETLVRGAGLSIDFFDDVKFLDAESLRGYKLLVMLRDGMNWPNGYPPGGNEPPIVSAPPLPKRE